MFRKNLMLKLHAILLHNHSTNVRTCMASKRRKPTPESARAMCMWTTLPKRIQAGQSENEFSPGFNHNSTGGTSGVPLEKIELESEQHMDKTGYKTQKLG